MITLTILPKKIERRLKEEAGTRAAREVELAVKDVKTFVEKLKSSHKNLTYLSFRYSTT
jgi:hypothetical protein